MSLLSLCSCVHIYFFSCTFCSNGCRTPGALSLGLDIQLSEMDKMAFRVKDGSSTSEKPKMKCALFILVFD